MSAESALSSLAPSSDETMSDIGDEEYSGCSDYVRFGSSLYRLEHLARIDVGEEKARVFFSEPCAATWPHARVLTNESVPGVASAYISVHKGDEAFEDVVEFFESH